MKSAISVFITLSIMFFVAAASKSYADADSYMIEIYTTDEYFVWGGNNKAKNVFDSNGDIYLTCRYYNGESGSFSHYILVTNSIGRVVYFTHYTIAERNVGQHWICPHLNDFTQLSPGSYAFNIVILGPTTHITSTYSYPFIVE